MMRIPCSRLVSSIVTNSFQRVANFCSSTKKTLSLPPSLKVPQLPAPTRFPSQKEERKEVVDEYMTKDIPRDQPFLCTWNSKLEGGRGGQPKEPGHIVCHDPKSGLTVSRSAQTGTFRKLEGKETRVRSDMTPLPVWQAAPKYSTLQQDLMTYGRPSQVVPVPGMSSEELKKGLEQERTEQGDKPYQLMGAPGIPSNNCVDAVSRVTNVPLPRPEAEHDPTTQEAASKIVGERLRQMEPSLETERIERRMEELSPTEKWMLRESRANRRK